MNFIKWPILSRQFLSKFIVGGKRMFLEISGTVHVFSFLDDTGLEGGTRVKGLPRSGALHP